MKRMEPAPLRCPYCLVGFHVVHKGKCPVCLHVLTKRAITQAYKLAAKRFDDVDRERLSRLFRQDAAIKAARTKIHRRKIAPSRRAAIYERDGHQCVRCGSMDNLTLDHIVPLARGGTNRSDNLQTMCSPCNGAKGSTLTRELQIGQRDGLLAA